MDQSVIDAIAKWPNVPACTGWLLLDRRGQWRMRDDACQAAGELGDPIRHAALKAFIERNYADDEVGRWFFQNGPQRVFVDLAYTPLVLRLHAATDNASAPILIDQCGRPFDAQAAWIDDAGNVLFSDSAQAPTGTIALLHDHDLALFSEYAMLTDDQAGALLDGTPVAPENGDADALGTINWLPKQSIPLLRIRSADVAQRFSYVACPVL